MHFKKISPARDIDTLSTPLYAIRVLDSTVPNVNRLDFD